MFKIIGTDIEGRAFETNPKKFTLPRYQDCVSLKSPLIVKETLSSSKKKYAAKNVKARLQRDLIERERDMSKKKNRLKEFLENEEHMYVSELETRAMSVKMERLRKEKEYEDQIEKERQKKEEEMLAKKKLELDMSKCKEIRKILADRREKETKAFQKMQIHEKNQIQNNEYKTEEMWHQMMVQDVAARKSIEDERKLKEQQMKQAMKVYLDRQVELASKTKKEEHTRQKDDEIKHCTEVEKQLNLRFSKENEKRKNMKKILSNELCKQMKESRERAQSNKNEVIALENTIISLSLAEKSAEKRKKISHMDLERRDIDMFNKHLAEVKQRREKQERNDNLMVNNTANEIFLKIDDDKRKWSENRKELLKMIITERNRQIEEKQREKERIHRTKALEIQKKIELQQNISEIETEERRALRSRKESYKESLKNQIRTSQTLKQTEAEKELIKHEEMLKEEKRMNEKFSDILKKEFNTENIHPFTRLIKRDSVSHTNWYSFIPETKYIKY